eukprot:gene6320-6969_t
MEGILKYQRLQGVFDSIFAHDRITAAAIATSFLVIGCESGDIHLLSFTSQQQQQQQHRSSKVKAHDAPVNSISLLPDGSGLTILSCSDNGDVVFTTYSSAGEVMKESSSFQFDLPIRIVCFQEGSGTSSQSSSSSSTAGGGGGGGGGGGSSTSKRSQHSFLAGAANGALIYRRAGWLKQKTVILSPGNGSPVTTLAWRGGLVAWADLSSLRVMDLTSQTAICRLNIPHGILPDDGIDCKIFFKSDHDLFVAWGASMRVLHFEVASAASQAVLGGGCAPLAATITVDWTSDSIICGVYPFDRDHLLYLGYAPPDESEDSHCPSIDQEEDDDGGGEEEEEVVVLPQEESYNNNNEAEIIIAKIATGEVVYSGLLSLRGSNMQGPHDYLLLSSYAYQAGGSQESEKWSLQSMTSTQGSRGGDRGLAPLFFLLSSQDAVLARLVDINDRVTSALAQGHLRQAVEIARSDRSSLRAYSYHDLFMFYLDNLLSPPPPAPASTPPGSGSTAVLLDHGGPAYLASLGAKECGHFVGPDVLLWEKVVQRFKQKHYLHYLCLSLPLESPRLAQEIYEESLYYLLAHQEVDIFVKVVKKWSPVLHPSPLFAHDHLLALLNALNTQNNSRAWSCLEHTAGQLEGVHLVALQQNDSLRLPLLEAEAQLHLVAKNYDKVLSCYLDTDFNHIAIASTTTGNGNGNGNGVSAGGGGGNSGQSEYRNVFDLIEKNNLFTKVEAKISNLIRLSKPLSGRLLVNHVDKLPIRRIAMALQADPALLFWYLHLLFTDSTTKTDYSNEELYGDLHQRQLQLYIDYAPTTLYRNGPLPPHTSSGSSGRIDLEDVVYYRKHFFESDLIHFIRAGLASYDVTLRLCETHNPPLYLEMIMLYLLMGEARRGLGVILDDLANVPLGIEYVEYFLIESGKKGDHINNKLQQGKAHRQGMRYSSTPITIANNNGSNGNGNGSSNSVKESISSNQLQQQQENGVKQHYIELWDELIRYVLKKDPASMAIVLDYLPFCEIDAFLIIRAMRPHLAVAGLKSRLHGLMQHQVFQKTLDDQAALILQKESVALIAQKNHGQRRAIKLSSQLRCKYCLRPLPFEPPLEHSSASSAAQAHMLPVNKEYIQIWGPRRQLPVTASASSSFSADTPSPAMLSGGSGSSLGPGGAVIFSNKLAFHRACYDRLLQEDHF